jgi:hypothetical protein
MATSLREILAPDVLYGTVQRIKETLDTSFMPPEFLSPALSVPTLSDSGYIVVGQGTNRTAGQAMKGSASRPVTLSGLERRPQVLIHSAHNYEVKYDVLQGLQNPRNQTEEEISRFEIDRRTAEATKLSMALRFGSILNMLGSGENWFDGNGNLLGSSSGAAFTIDYGVPANNKNQLNGIISASWATATTKIITHCQAVQKQAMINAQRPIRAAVYGKNIFDYIVDNNQAKEFLNRNPQMQTSIAQGLIPDGFGGIAKWYPGWLHGFETAAGTYVTPIGDTKVVFLPEITSDVYTMFEGHEPVPSDSFGAFNIENLASSVSLQRGMFAYAQGETDPVRAKVVFGDNFLPSLHLPSCVFIATVAGF